MIDIKFENSPVRTREILSLYTGEEDKYFQNREAVDRLKAECDLLAKGVCISTSAAPLLALFPNLISLVGKDRIALGTEYLLRIGRLHSVARMLIDYFGDTIEITLRVKTNSAIIDIFVRMPDKRIFALAVRGSEDTTVKWHKDHQCFVVKRKGKGGVKSEPLTRAISMLNTVIDLRKGKHPLMGTGSSQRNAPMIKAIVLTRGAKISAHNPPEIKTKFGNAEVLKIQENGIIYVVESDSLIQFMLLPPKSIVH